MRVKPVTTLRGKIELPADKSISHRYALLGAMAEGTTRISNYSGSEDCLSTLQCLRKLGPRIKQFGTEVEIESEGWTQFQQPSDHLDAGNSGTLIRLLSALLSASKFTSTIHGDESVNQRPMKRIITPLTRMGATIQARENEYPPLHVSGSHLRAIDYHLPIPSAQVKSCVLLAGLMAEGKTSVTENTPSRDHTERALPCFQVEMSRQGRRLMVAGPASLSPAQMEIPGDFSAAAFFVIAALMVPNSEISMMRTGINPSRTGLLALLEKANAGIEQSGAYELNHEPVCDLLVRFREETLERFPHEIGGDWIPNLIDEIPVLAVLGTRLPKGLAIREAGELRKKESDRIHSVVSNLRNLGVQVEEFPDGLAIPPGQQIRGGQVRTFGDHRIAMAFAIAGLIADGPVELDDAACVSVSFPDFFERLQAICR